MTTNDPALEAFRARCTIIPVVPGRGKSGNASSGSERLLIKEDGPQAGLNHSVAFEGWIRRCMTIYEGQIGGKALDMSERTAFLINSFSNLLKPFEGEIKHIVGQDGSVLILWRHDRVPAHVDIAAMVFPSYCQTAPAAPAEEAPGPRRP